MDTIKKQQKKHQWQLTIPCQFGDDLYLLKEMEKSENELAHVEQHVAQFFEIRPLQMFVIDEKGNRYNFKGFGKSWFLNYEEAVKRLTDFEKELMEV